VLKRDVTPSILPTGQLRMSSDRKTVLSVLEQMKEENGCGCSEPRQIYVENGQ